MSCSKRILLELKDLYFQTYHIVRNPTRAEIELFISVILYCDWNYRRFEKQLKVKSKFWEM